MQASTSVNLDINNFKKKSNNRKSIISLGDLPFTIITFIGISFSFMVAISISFKVYQKMRFARLREREFFTKRSEWLNRKVKF